MATAKMKVDGQSKYLVEFTMDSLPALDMAFWHKGKYYKVRKLDDDGKGNYVCIVKEVDPKTGDDIPQ